MKHRRRGGWEDQMNPRAKDRVALHEGIEPRRWDVLVITSHKEDP